HLDVLHRVALLLREVAHLLLCKLDVVEIALRDLADRFLDFLRRKLEARRRPLVEFLGEVAHRRIAARLDVGQDALNGRAPLRVALLDRARTHSAFQVRGHWWLLLFLIPSPERGGSARSAGVGSLLASAPPGRASRVHPPRKRGGMKQAI